MTFEQLCMVLTQIEYRDWTFVVSDTALAGAYTFQVAFTDGGETWKGRKWLISPHATRSEVVQTALKAVLAAEEHEAREKFLYRGRAIFGPHFDVDQLHQLCGSAEALDARVPV